MSVSKSTTTGSAPKAACVSSHSVTAASPAGSSEPMAVSTSSRVKPRVVATASTARIPPSKDGPPLPRRDPQWGSSGTRGTVPVKGFGSVAPPAGG